MKYLKWGIVVLAISSANVSYADDACVDERIQNFRNLHGEEEPIRFDVLEEWESECSANSTASPSTTPDVDLYIGTNQFSGALTFDLQAIDDDVVVRDVVINRGVCEIPPGTATDLSRGVHLEFGREYRGYSNNCTVSNVRELIVTTDRGSYQFNFSR
tara:strand:+ start:1652 stop:2125 length:474 start_codon:yes stop_codon:yes gene_type:complete